MKSLGLRPALVFVLVLMALGVIGAETLVDVVYLRNGSIVKGQVLEQVPEGALKIQTSDGSLFVFQMSEVERIVKEPATGAAAGAPAAPASALPKNSIVVNPLGFAQFGPFIKGEIEIRPSVYLTPWIRFHALGVISEVVENVEGEDLSVDLSSLGLGVGVMRFFPDETGRKGMYLGAMAEYGWISTLHAPEESWEWRTKSAHIAIVANVGYRWRWAPVSVLLGGIAGASIGTSASWWYTASGGYQGDSSIHDTGGGDLFPFAMLELSIGYEI